jgi:hypothetical protein
MFQQRLSTDECASLVFLLVQQGALDLNRNIFNHPLHMDGDGIVTIGDEVEAAAKKIMSQPNWQRTGATAGLTSYSDAARKEKESEPLTLGGHKIAMDMASRTESLAIAMASTGQVLVNGADNTLAKVDAVQLKTAILDRLNRCRSTEGQVNVSIQAGAVSSQSQVEQEFAKVP